MRAFKPGYPSQGLIPLQGSPSARCGKARAAAVSFALALLLALSCSPSPPDLSVLASSESADLDPVLKDFAKEKRIKIAVDYRGSVDIMLELEADESSYDAVWPANSLWLQLGDVKKRVKLQETFMSSPIVFGVRASLAKKFGWDKGKVLVRDILSKIRSGELTFMMASATQSNSGAGAYLGFLYALAGNPVVLSGADLAKPALREGVRDILKGLDRSSGNSMWLKELFLKSDADCMVNYEALVVEANLALEAQGKEPLFMVYPADGISVADYPLGFIDRAPGSKRQKLFTELKDYLRSAPVRARMEALGRRSGLGGVASNPDPRVFRPEWGAKPGVSIASVPLPPRDVILEALTLYQTEFRKPSYTTFVLDFSGSMYGKGEAQLKAALGLVFDAEQSSRILLQAGSRDVTRVIAFSNEILKEWVARGNDPARLSAVLDDIRAFEPGGGTDIHGPLIEALQRFSKEPGREGYVPSIILMTDGADNRDPSFEDFAAAWGAMGAATPVFCITFGEADEKQLKKIADLTKARVFDGRRDLAASFRTAKGYN